jgi:adenylate cyclase
MRSRVGLHTGPAVVGNIGSKLRFNYTMMGDTVNLAQRIEAAAGHYGAGILVSGETFAAASKDDPELVFRALDRILVPGRTQPVAIYELLGRGDEAAAACAERISSYAAARSLYREGCWAEAAEAFRVAARRELFPDAANPPLLMAIRCDRLIGQPARMDYICPLSKG